MSSRQALLGVAAAAAIVLTAACGGGAPAADGAAQVCVNHYATMPILEDALTGLKRGLAEAGYPEGERVTFDVRNPEGDAATQQTIASQFLGDSCQVIVGFTTPGSQVFLQPQREAPLVFFASSAPLDSKLAESLERPGNNTTGVSDPLPVEFELETMRAIDPDVRRVGLVWKTGDPSGDALAARAKAAAAAAGVEIVEAPITNPSDTTQSARSLLGKVDAIQVAGDGPTVSGVAGLLQVAAEAGVPVFGGTTESVTQGALLAGVYDYEVLGAAAGGLVAQVLDGAERVHHPGRRAGDQPDRRQRGDARRARAGVALRVGRRSHRSRPVNTLTTALEVGFQFVPLVFGIYLSLIVLSLPDLTIEGSFGLGGATCAACLTAGVPPVTALLLAMAAGALAGATTGFLHVLFRVNTLLASILVTASCWSVCLFVMGGANVSLVGMDTLHSTVQSWGLSYTAASLVVGGGVALLCFGVLCWLLSTDFGATLRATGLNIQTSRALGVRTESRQVVGLAVANGLVGLSGALVVQQQGFMDVSIQVGTLVIGIAALVIGRTIIRSERPILALTAVVVGIVVYRYVVAWTLENGGSANSLRLVTSVAVLVVLVARGHLRLWTGGCSRRARQLRRRVRTDFLEADRVSPIL